MQIEAMTAARCGSGAIALLCSIVLLVTKLSAGRLCLSDCRRFT